MGILEGILYMIWRGLAIGAIISAPMGPVGILCVQRTLEKGRRTGFYTGLGAAASDLFYCLVTGFGLSFIEEFLKANQDVIQITGSVVLAVFGVYLFRSNPSRKLKKPDSGRGSLGKEVLSGFLFTFSNPLIIFLIIGLFARFNFLLPEITIVHYAVGFVSIFAGALMWWWIVTYFVDKVRSHFNLRSMWLINKITGCIIMIFSLVGIVTAFGGIAGAALREPEYYNSHRGFGALSADSASGPLMIAGTGPDTACVSIPLSGAADFTVTFRASNLSAGNARQSRYAGADGRTHTAPRPAWGISCGIRSFTVTSIHDPYDDMITSRIEISGPGGIATVRGGADFTDGPNTWSLRRRGDRMALLAGNRRLETVMETDFQGPSPDHIRLFVLPGCRLEVDYISADAGTNQMPSRRSELSHFADPDVRESYFRRSTDDMEGIWEIFDRQLEDAVLRVGGEYRLAIVSRGNGRDYDMIYLGGAVKNGSSWVAGMRKGTLRGTSFSGVYDVEWLDPAGRLLDGDIKAQLTSRGVVTFQFPDHAGSSLRLRKVK